MVRIVLEDVAETPLQVYNRLRLLTRDFLLSQVPITMRAPRKAGGSMQPGTNDHAESPKPPVCRRLFHDPITDQEGFHDNMMNQFMEQTERNLDKFSEKYNFDFRNEEALEGNFSWERITPDGKITPMVPRVSSELPAEPPTSEPPTAEAPSPLEPPSVPQ